MRVTRKRLLRGPHRWGVRRLPHPSSKGMRLKASLRPRHRLRVRTRNSGTTYAVTQRFGSRCEHFAFGVGGNLTVLGVFKYANFALMNVNAPLTASAFTTSPTRIGTSGSTGTLDPAVVERYKADVVIEELVERTLNASLADPLRR